MLKNLFGSFWTTESTSRRKSNGTVWPQAAQVEILEERRVPSAVMHSAAVAAKSTAHHASAAHATAHAAATQTAIPSQATTYSITSQGTVYRGSTNFLSSSTKFTAVGTFSRRGALVVTPTADPYAASGNGVNPRDVLITTGTLGLSGTGNLNFASNTLLDRLVGVTAAANAAVDVSYVTMDSAHSRLTITVDANHARLNPFNLMTTSNSLTAFPGQVIAGQMVIDFGNQGKTVSGSYTFYTDTTGGTAAISGTFSGTRSGS